ncbi:MAG: ornithine carbamoyltransferase [Candidatus Omnitrophota bacterium]
MEKDLISIKNLTRKDLDDIFILTDGLKKTPDRFSHTLERKMLALIFEKPSCRTRVSFEVGMYQLGGGSLYLGPDQIKLGLRESIGDIARTLSRYVDGIVLRTFAHENIIQMSEFAAVPVINALTDLLHPCQALADLYTIRERFSDFNGLTLAFIGDGNNVCHSLLYACSKLGLNLNIAAPKRYSPQSGILKEAKAFALISGAKINLFNEAGSAAKGADLIYTDVWASMGQDKEAKVRRREFKNFQLNKELMLLAKKKCLVMHCLPAHRGEEITQEVIDSPNSIVFDQAENRLHVQKAVLIKLLNK